MPMPGRYKCYACDEEILRRERDYYSDTKGIYPLCPRCYKHPTEAVNRKKFEIEVKLAGNPACASA